MNTEDQNTELIELFLQNKLDADQKKEVQDNIDTDPEFKALFESQRNIFELVRIKGRQDLKTKLIALDSEQSGNVRKMYMQKFLMVAAVLVICFGLGTWFMLDSVKTAEQLYAENFEPFRAPANVRGEVEENNWATISNLYEDKEYDEAAALLISDESFDKRNHVVQFYLGMCYLSNDNSTDDTDAVDAFYEVLKKSNDYTQQAEWYLALTYLKLNLSAEAKMVFDGIRRNPDHYKKRQAKSISKSIK